MQKNTAMFDKIVWYFNYINKEHFVFPLILRRINYKHSGHMLHFRCD